MAKKANPIEVLWKNEIMPLLENPSVFRPLVILVIASVGFGAAGMPMYFKVQDLNAQYLQEKSKYDLLRASYAIKDTLKVYQERMSGKTEFLQWVSELRDISKDCNVTISDISPSMVGKPDKGIQKLMVTAKYSGEYRNLLKLVGVMQNRRETITVNEINFAYGSGKCSLNLSLSMLLVTLPDKKKTAEVKPDQSQPLKTPVGGPAVPQNKPQPVAAEQAKTPGKPAAAPVQPNKPSPGASAVNANKAQISTDDAHGKPEVKTHVTSPSPVSPPSSKRGKSGPGKFDFEESAPDQNVSPAPSADKPAAPPPGKPAVKPSGSSKQNMLEDNN